MRDDRVRFPIVLGPVVLDQPGDGVGQPVAQVAPSVAEAKACREAAGISNSILMPAQPTTHF